MASIERWGFGPLALFLSAVEDASTLAELPFHILIACATLPTCRATKSSDNSTAMHQLGGRAKNKKQTETERFRKHLK
eukprot:604302-Amphidinium_carterae.1